MKSHHTNTRRCRKTASLLGYVIVRAFSCVSIVTLIALPIGPVFADTESSDLNTSADAQDLQNLVQSPDEIMYEQEVESPEEDIIVDEEAVNSSETQTSDETPEQTLAINETSTPKTVIENAQDMYIPVQSPSSTPAETSSEGAPNASTSFEIPQNTSSEPLASESTTTPTSTTEIPVQDEIKEEATTTATTTEESIDDEASSTTEPLIVYETLVDPNQLSFSKQECVSVGDGMFYCAAATTTPKILMIDRIFSAPDEDGDKEIYLEHDGELLQLTKNQYDDDAPYYDKVSNTIVFHRLVDGRYQIISHDVEEGTEEIVAYDSFNNMQPNRFGKITVWQGWVGNDWEIFVDDAGKREMLTDNTTHDIAPTVNDTHIVWQTFENNVWIVKVYDMRTHITETIGESNGSAAQNPRFVLVYDTELESGDIKTKGYDLKTGATLDLGAKPREVPKKLPEPDQTGEERALITQISQTKPKQNENGEDSEFGDEPETPSNFGDLVIPGNSSIEVGTSTEELTLDLSTTTVPILEENTVFDTNQVPVLVIPPYNEHTDSGAGEDSQSGIASTT